MGSCTSSPMEFSSCTNSPSKAKSAQVVLPTAFENDPSSQDAVSVITGTFTKIAASTT